MRAVVQRVTRAVVSVDGRAVGRIGSGLLVFAGVGTSDGAADVEYIAGKLHDLRIFPDEHGRMNRSVVESGGALLVISQFTLLGDCRKGRRPSFDAAAPAPLAQTLYEDLVTRLRSTGLSSIPSPSAMPSPKLMKAALMLPKADRAWRSANV